MLPATSQPWINQAGTVSGSYTGRPANMNNIAVNDQVDAGFNWVNCLHMVQNVQSPATGLRSCIFAKTQVTGAGTQTPQEAQYVGVTAQVVGNSSLGGTESQGVGEFWGGWIYANITAGSYLDQAFGCEVDASVSAGASINTKIGLLVNTAAWDAMRGTRQDAAIVVACATGASTTWQNGLVFGRNQTLGTANWPFDNTSTMIGVTNPGHAGVGIDFTGVKFAGPAIKVPAPIAMSEMASPPTAVAGEGQVYVASDGSLHYRGPKTDTKLAPA